MHTAILRTDTEGQLMREVDNATASRLMVDQSLLYIDVRTPAEFAEGHPEGAYNVPISLGFGLNIDFVTVVQTLTSTTSTLLLGCRTGGRSASACQVLERAGFTDVINVSGGFVGIPAGPMGAAVPGWKALGLPSSTASSNSYAAILDRIHGAE